MANETGNDPGPRSWIAIAIVIFGLASALTLGIIVLSVWDKKDQASALVLSSILPVIGTWVGTILAYYFAKDNFESAARNARTVMGARLDPGAPVRDAMIPRDKIEALKLNPGDKAESLTLGALKAKFVQAKRNRLPVLVATGEICYVVHRSTLDEMMIVLLEAGKAKADIEATTLETVFAAHQRFKVTLEGTFAIVKETATIADAKVAMDSTPNCQDVFVTANGRKNEPVLGWLTNNEIEQYTKV